VYAVFGELQNRNAEAERRFFTSYSITKSQEVSMLAKLIVIVFVCCVPPVVGQSLSEIDREYGKPTYAYSVSRYIWMTPEYAADGQVCRMRLYPKHIDSKTDYLAPELNFEELTSVLNKLVPLEQRGQKKDSFGITEMGGGVAWTTYEYEKVTFVFAFPFRLDPSIKEQPASVTFPMDEITAHLPAKTPPSLADFANSESTKIQIAAVLWNNRKCGP